LFRDYVEQLQEYDKKFVILGNSNAITYKEIFRLIKENKIWLGKSIHSGDVEFRVPAHYEIRSKSFRIGEDGNSYIKVPSIRWFTNLDYKERHEDLILYKEYSPEEYPKYDNYDAINLDITKNIPLDYIGAMGVPITFMDKYSPDQFEIIALGIVGSIDFTCNKRMEILDKDGIPTGKSTFNAKGTLYRPYNPIKDSSPAFKNSET
jgi:Adenine-specific methyltransferase EcoRI